MFRSSSNIRCLSFDDDDDPAACVRMAARGIHDDGMTSFFTTNIPHEDEYVSENSFCNCISYKDKMNNNNNTYPLSYRAKIYAVAEEPKVSNHVPENKYDNERKKTDTKKIRVSRSLDGIEIKGNKFRIQVKSRKVKSFDNACDSNTERHEK